MDTLIPFAANIQIPASQVLECNLSNSDSYPSPGLRIPLPLLGSVTLFICDVFSNTLDGNAVMTVLKNGNATGLTVTFAPGETGSKTKVLNVVVAVNDKFSFKIDTMAATMGYFMPVMSSEYIGT